MTVPAGGPGDEVPVEDWAEQAVDAGPAPQGDWTADASPASRGTVEANEADLAEQEYAVDLGEDEQ